MPLTSTSPQSLLLVRSTLEMAALLKSLHPSLKCEVDALEKEVLAAGQLLIDAGSVARARIALETIHGTRLALQELQLQQQYQADFRLAA